jgi:hypothetical protein
MATDSAEEFQKMEPSIILVAKLHLPGWGNQRRAPSFMKAGSVSPSMTAWLCRPYPKAESKQLRSIVFLVITFFPIGCALF